MPGHPDRVDSQFSNGFRAVLDALEGRYGVQRASWPHDPYLFLAWWNCGYPASDAACTKGFDALKRAIGTEPGQILAATDAAVTEAIRAGGIIPEVRTERLKEVADRADTLRSLKAETARAVLKTFAGIGDPGADRILLFAEIEPVAAVPSSSPQTVLRIQTGRESGSYSRNYKEAQKLLSESVEKSFPARQRAYLLLRKHGDEICKRTRPRCQECPISAACSYPRSLAGIHG